ncbi:MAG: type III-B CRISPR module RAMP protein Cmr6 [Streptosporangiaceae bacterium]
MAMPDREQSWQLVGPLSGRLAVTDEDGLPRLRRPGAQPGSRTGAENANARLILHRTAVFKVTSDAGGPRFGDLDDWPIRTWAVETGLGQKHAVELRAALAARRAKAVESLAAATSAAVRSVDLTPQGALITGTGSGGIRDVGIELHGTYGWPVIPATALKGVADAYARDAADVSAAVRARIFGTPRAAGEPDAAREGADADSATPASAKAAAGSVLFLDALPGPGGVAVAEHVLTPHARDYHTGHGAAGGGERPPPAEYVNPVPIPFLAVQGGTFTAYLVGPEPDIGTAADLLAAAVDDIGAGAKTSAGYGYLDATVRPATLAPPGSAR